MSITLAGTDFEHHHFDDRRDVLCLSVARFKGDALVSAGIRQS